MVAGGGTAGAVNRWRGRALGEGQVLLAQTAGRVVLEVGLEKRRAAGLTSPVGALAQPLERPIHAIEVGRGPGQLRFVVLLHDTAG